MKKPPAGLYGSSHLVLSNGRVLFLGGLWLDVYGSQRYPIEQIPYSKLTKENKRDDVKHEIKYCTKCGGLIDVSIWAGLPEVES